MNLQLLEDFSSGHYESQGDYESFIPAKMNTPRSWTDPEINELLQNASYALGSLRMYSPQVPEYDIFVHMLMANEAVKSSKIEGTHTDLEEFFRPIDELAPEKRYDRQEVQNYFNALTETIPLVLDEGFPLSTRLICTAHRILMYGARGQNKSPGSYRKSQNWIGGEKPSDARLVPPPATRINELISDLENFLHAPHYALPELIRVGMAHWQFETIHPFLDGNGRVGRLIILWYLLETGLLHVPCFFIADYIEKHRQEYYDRLHAVVAHSDMINWLKFFLTATIETVRTTHHKFECMTDLMQEYEAIRPQIDGETGDVNLVFRHMYHSPVFSITELASATNLADDTLQRIVDSMQAKGVVHAATGVHGDQRYVAKDFLRIFE